MELCSGGASRACCACTLLDCCAPDDPATPGAVSAGALLIAKRSDNLDAFSGGCVIHPSQSGFVIVPMITTSTAQATEIAIQLTNLSQKYSRCRGGGWKMGSGSYSRCLDTSSSRSLPEEGDPRSPPRSPLVSCLNTTPEIRPRYNLDRLVGRYSRNWSVLSLVQWPFLRNFSDQLNGGRVKTSLFLFFGQILLRVLSTAMDELVASLMPLAREARDKRAQRRGRLVARQAR